MKNKNNKAKNKLVIKRELLVYVLFIFLIGLVECGPPQLNVPSEWVFTISENETSPLEITCSGDKPVQWSTEVPQNYIKYENGPIGSQYYSTLKIDEPVKDDTGYFNCSYAGEEGGVTRSTYVYVHDGTSGFIVDNLNRLIVRMDFGNPHLLDCRTTRPDIKVTVFKNGKEISRSEYKFNPRIGVILEGPNYIGQMIQCKNNYKTDIASFIIQPKPKRKMQKPSIENRRNSYYVVGEEFALNCSIAIDKKDNPTFKWVLPNKYANKQITLFGDKIFTISTLKIKNPTLSDSGNYTCIVEQGDYSASDNKIIEVKETVVPFVQFEGKHNPKQHFLFLKEGDDFHCVMYFEGYPKNLKNTIYNPFKNALLHKDKRVSTKYDYEDGKLSLSIKRVTAEDFGNYSVRLEAPNGSYDESYVMLIVNATPKIEFGDTPSLLPDNKIVSITAFILAFTLNKNKFYPNVDWWLYTDCPEGIGSCDKSNGMMLPHTLVKDTGPHNHFKSVVTLQPTASGELVCEVRNNLGINDTRMYLNVSDKSAPFLIQIHTEEGFINLTRHEALKTVKVIEGGDIRFECSSLDFLYEKLTFNHSVSSTYRCDTKLSSAWCSSITNIALGNDVSYKCVAHDRVTKNVETISFRISIVEKMTPKILPSSNVSEEGITISVKPFDPFFIACYVEGRPKPNITWLKDGINIYEIPEYLENKDKLILKNNNQILEFKFAQKEYEGMYECRVRNRVGHIQSYANVMVEGVPLTFVEIGIISLAVGVIVILCSVIISLVVRVKKKIKLREHIRQTQLYLFERGNVGDLNKEGTIDE